MLRAMVGDSLILKYPDGSYEHVIEADDPNFPSEIGAQSEIVEQKEGNMTMKRFFAWAMIVFSVWAFIFYAGLTVQSALSGEWSEVEDRAFRACAFLAYALLMDYWRKQYAVEKR